MYKGISGISLFLRTFIFPNPFEKYIELYLQNTLWATSSSSISYFFNLAIGGTILWIICYPLVGIIYDRGECPALGSVLYGVLILINSKILVVISKAMTEINIKTFAIRFGLVLILEIGVLIGIRYTKGYISSVRR